jgi:hypothetical protein
MKLFKRCALVASASLAFSLSGFAHEDGGADKPDTHAHQHADSEMHKKAKHEHHHKGKKPAKKHEKDMDAPMEEQAPEGADHK